MHIPSPFSHTSGRRDGIMKQICNLLIFAVLSVVVFKRRYQLFNYILGNQWLRKISVNAAMTLPSVRNQFIKSAFRK